MNYENIEPSRTEKLLQAGFSLLLTAAGIWLSLRFWNDIAAVDADKPAHYAIAIGGHVALFALGLSAARLWDAGRTGLCILAGFAAMIALCWNVSNSIGAYAFADKIHQARAEGSANVQALAQGEISALDAQSAQLASMAQAGQAAIDAQIAATQRNIDEMTRKDMVTKAAQAREQLNALMAQRNAAATPFTGQLEALTQQRLAAGKTALEHAGDVKAGSPAQAFFEVCARWTGKEPADIRALWFTVLPFSHEILVLIGSVLTGSGMARRRQPMQAAASIAPAPAPGEPPPPASRPANSPGDLILPAKPFAPEPPAELSAAVPLYGVNPFTFSMPSALSFAPSSIARTPASSIARPEAETAPEMTQGNSLEAAPSSIASGNPRTPENIDILGHGDAAENAPGLALLEPEAASIARKLNGWRLDLSRYCRAAWTAKGRQLKGRDEVRKALNLSPSRADKVLRWIDAAGLATVQGPAGARKTVAAVSLTQALEKCRTAQIL